MFDETHWKKWHDLTKAIDEINQKFGKDTVRFASVKPEGLWTMKQTRRSQRYTTCWQEFLTVH
jgi:DNA polymerase V